jgi:pimeloyl-ACP methyl ester carboxylesterase
MQITSGNAVLAAESQGSGSPDVLMIHAGVTDQRSWRHVIDRLPDHRCLTYDQRGYGRTTYTAEDGWSQVDDAVAVLDAYEVASAIVVGCSMGGRGALDLALSHPDRVQALVLIGSAVSGAPPLEGEPGLEDLEKQYDAAYDAHDLAELNRLEAWIWLDGPHRPEGRVGGPARELFLDMNRIALEAAETGDERHDVNAWEHCGEIRVPTLVLIGEHDLDHTHGNATHLAEQIPGARLVHLPGVAHLPHLEADERTLSEISGFVAGI